MSKKLQIIIIFIILILLLISIALPQKQNSLKLYNAANFENIQTTLINIKNSNLISFSIKFNNAGTINNPSETRGISEIIKRFLFKKNDNLSMHQTKQNLYRLGIHEISIDTHEDFVISFVTTKEKLLDVMEYVSNIFSVQNINQNIIESSKNFSKCISDELQLPYNLCINEAMKLLFLNSPYSQNISDYISNIQSISINDIQMFFVNYFNTHNCEIICAGNIPGFELDRSIEVLCKKLSKSGHINHPLTNTYKLSEIKTKNIFKNNMDDDTVVIGIGINTDLLSDIQLAALYIVTKALFDKDTGKYTNMLQNNNIAYQCDTEITPLKIATVFHIIVTMKKEKASKYLNFIKNINNAKNIENFNLSIFENSKRFFIEKQYAELIQLTNLEKQLKFLKLPFNDVSIKEIKEVLSKIFDEKMQKTIILSNNNIEE